LTGASRLVAQPRVGGWTNPRLGVRFVVTVEMLALNVASKFRDRALLPTSVLS